MKLWNIIKNKKAIILLAIVLLIIGLFVVLNILKKTVYASSQEIVKNDILNIKEDTNKINLYQIIEKNNISDKEEIIVEEIDLEYTTKYQNNSDLAKGSLQVLQEGRIGKKQVTLKNTYNEVGEIISTEELESKILIAAIDKIVEVGTANYTNNYKAQKGDKLYVTPSSVKVKVEPSVDSETVITINQEEEVTLLETSKEWYKISYKNYIGWIEVNCLKTETSKQETNVATGGKSKSQLLKNLNMNMALNKPSGLTLEQFKKVLSNQSNDKNKIFKNNAEYFYYAEKQYNVNGIFLAAVGIHESGWGTSKIALNKKNLFGYGAYDNSAYSSSYTFSSYSEGIDLIARVFVKYYLNPAGTKIYNGETASGKYYNGNTLTAVNKKYATDKNWANGVYKWMSHLYNAI